MWTKSKREREYRDDGKDRPGDIIKYHAGSPEGTVYVMFEYRSEEDWICEICSARVANPTKHTMYHAGWATHDWQRSPRKKQRDGSYVYDHRRLYTSDDRRPDKVR